MEDDQIQRKSKSVVDVKEEWPWWQKWLASLINYSALIVWVVVSYLLISFVADNPDLVWNQVLYLTVVVPAVAYGLLSLVAGVVVLTYFNPWMRPSRYKDGSDHEKRTMVYYWVGVLLSVALVIYGAN
jgi:hypothetical protein